MIVGYRLQTNKAHKRVQVDAEQRQCTPNKIIIETRIYGLNKGRKLNASSKDPNAPALHQSAIAPLLATARNAR